MCIEIYLSTKDRTRKNEAKIQPIRTGTSQPAVSLRTNYLPEKTGSTMFRRKCFRGSAVFGGTAPNTSKTGFCRFIRKLHLFLNKLLNSKIFNLLFVIKKVTLIFGARRLLSPQNCQMRPQNSFSRFSRKILLFSKKLFIKKKLSI